MTQYDVELYQKIMNLTGQQMELFQTQQEAVLLLLERVNEAQRIATMQVRTRQTWRVCMYHLQSGMFVAACEHRC